MLAWKNKSVLERKRRVNVWTVGITGGFGGGGVKVKMNKCVCMKMANK